MEKGCEKAISGIFSPPARRYTAVCVVTHSQLFSPTSCAKNMGETEETCQHWNDQDWKENFRMS